MSSGFVSARSSTLVAGLDACKEGWVGVALRDGELVDAALVATVADALERWAGARHVSSTSPIGLPGDGELTYPRKADVEARAFLRDWRASSSVFPAPPVAVLGAGSYEEAVAIAKVGTGVGISRQAFALVPKILEVRVLANSDPRVIEGHPEVTFRRLTSWSEPGVAPASSRKRTWNGLHRRRAALRAINIDLPDRLASAGEANADDVVDAAAMAWTAWAVATNRSGTYPDPPDAGVNGQPVAIHFPT
jgi:predicted RNase H-like nuclease